MMRLYDRFWVIVTSLACAVFAALFYPQVSGRYGAVGAVLLTAVGVVVIWVVYFVRACVFSKLNHHDEKTR